MAILSLFLLYNLFFTSFLHSTHSIPSKNSLLPPNTQSFPFGSVKNSILPPKSPSFPSGSVKFSILPPKTQSSPSGSVENSILPPKTQSFPSGSVKISIAPPKTQSSPSGSVKNSIFTPKTQSSPSGSVKNSILPPKGQSFSPGSVKNLVLPLKIQSLPSGSVKIPPNKLSFHHNVSLTVTLAVGSPPQPVTVVLDTGSELSWLRCKKTVATPLWFDSLRSKSYTRVPCTSRTCTTRTRDFTVPVSCDPNKLCHVIVSYADATSVEGNLAFDTFRLANSDLPGVAFGCMDSGSSSNQDEDSKTTGLLGMNRGSLSFVSQMGYPKFSYCISGRDSTGVLLFGDVKISWLTPLSYTPLVNISTPLPYFDRVAYTVQLEGIKVSGSVLSLPKSVYVPDHTGAGQTMVDSGTQFTFLLGPVYTALKNEFLKQTKSILRVYEDPDFVFQGAMDLCYRIDRRRVGLPVLPSVTLMFRGAEMSISCDRLLVRVPGLDKGNDQIHCFTFGNSDLLGIEAYVIGHHHQQNMWMEFDLVNSRVGLAEVRCDLASQKLGLGL